MPLILASLAALLQPTSAPTAATLCDALERRQERTAIELHDLATCLFRGERLPQDMVRARQLYTQAMEAGFTRSMCALGNMMIEGSGDERDVQGGLALCRRAANAGEAQAQADLGNYLLVGQVMPRDVNEARRWYILAARQGQANAAFVLGQIYWNGDGVAKDNSEAARWWRVAHDGGRPDAAHLLAREAFVRLTQSVTRPEDADPAVIEEAIRWFTIAERSDPTPAHRQDSRNQIAMLRQFQALLRQRQSQ